MPKFTFTYEDEEGCEFVAKTQKETLGDIEATFRSFLVAVGFHADEKEEEVEDDGWITGHCTYVPGKPYGG